MSKLLEIFGKAITVNTADLIWHWLTAVKTRSENFSDLQNREFDEIIELLGMLRLAEAEEKVKFYLFENPDCALGRMVAVTICLHRNQLKEAIDQLQSIYMRQPSNTMALYTLGYCYERLGHESQAIEFYQDCLKFKSHLQLPRQRLAAIYLKNGRIDRTIEEYEQLVVEHPDDISSLVLLSYLYAADGQWERATDSFNMAIISHPDNFNDPGDDAENDLLTEDNFEKAIERVQWLIETVGDVPDLHVRMADIYSKAGQTAEALVHYENALRIQPNYLEATIKLGTHHLRNHQPRLAAEQFNRAMEINDEIVDAYTGLVTAQHSSNQPTEAVSTLSLASAIQQNSTMLFSETATLQLQAAIIDQAAGTEEPPPQMVLADVINTYERQLAASPINGDVHYKCGILMMAGGDLKKAIRFFEAALQINPTHYRVRAKLAICLYEQGKVDAAIRALTAQNALDRKTIDLHYQTAILYCDKQRFAAAVDNLEKTLKDNFTDTDAAGNLEIVLENLGLIDRAMATWDRLTETAHNAISARYK